MPTPTTTTDQPRATPNEPIDPALIQIRDVIYKVAGIYQPESRLFFLKERCGRRFEPAGVKTAREYLECLTSRPNRDKELRELLNEITVGETCLFRGPSQLEALKNTIIPALTSGKAGIVLPKLRIWSAGCSTGEEPYTYAMFLLEELVPKYPGWTFEIIATDLNERSVAKAAEGIYGDYAVRNMPPYYRQKYLVPAGDRLEVKPEVKKHITFNRINLADDSKMLFMKGMNLISCCNVLIYFDGPSKRRVINHFYNNLLPGGYFYVGLSESLFGIENQFRLVHFPQATAYYKPTPQEAKAALPSSAKAT